MPRRLLIWCRADWRFINNFEQHRALDAGARDAIDVWHRDVSQASSVGRGSSGGVVIRQPGRRIEYVFSGGKLIRREPGRIDQVFAENVTKSAIEPVESGLWRLSWTARDTDGIRTWMREYGGLAAPASAEPETLTPEAAP